MRRAHEKNIAQLATIPRQVLNPTQLSSAMARATIKISSATSPEQQTVTIDLDSIKSNFPYGIGNQHAIVLHSLCDLILPPNQFNVLATMVVIQPDEEYSPQSPEPSIPSPVSTSPMNLSNNKGWETPYTTTDENKLYSEDEPRQAYWAICSSETFDSNEPRQVFMTSSAFCALPPPRRQRLG